MPFVTRANAPYGITSLLLPKATELLGGGLLRQDQSVAPLVRLDDLQRKPLADRVTKSIRHAAALGTARFPTEAS
jgi:hypothetical protein